MLGIEMLPYLRYMSRHMGFGSRGEVMELRVRHLQHPAIRFVQLTRMMFHYCHGLALCFADCWHLLPPDIVQDF